MNPIQTPPLYRSIREYWWNKYGERVQKVPLDAGFTCPNRDGTKGVGGCTYCNNDSFNFSPDTNLREQLRMGIEKAKRRYRARKFVAYFQAYTNTYGSPDLLYDIYSTIYEFPEIVGLSIGTRPDCVPEEVLKVIEKFVPTHDVWVEYGLESSHDETLKRINRGHTCAEFRDAVLRTQGRGIKIAAHIITGFPWESEQQMLQTGLDVAALPIDAIKIHNLHIVKGTALAVFYQRSPFRLQTLEEYARMAAQILEILPPEMYIMRLTGDAPPELLVAPDWCNRKMEILATIERNLRERNSYQGRLYRQENLKFTADFHAASY